jgi:hypothetical protein
VDVDADVANLCVRFFRFERPLAAYALLLVTIALQLTFSLERLLSFGAGARFVLAGALTFGPVLAANILFSRAFRDTAHPDRAFAWNLIGSMVGGTLEYASLLLGYQKLAFVVGGVYAVAGAFALRRTGVSSPAALAAPPA